MFDDTGLLMNLLLIMLLFIMVSNSLSMFVICTFNFGNESCTINSRIMRRMFVNPSTMVIIVF